MDISPTTRDFLEYCVCEVESSLGVGGEACDVAEPSLQEVADCVAALQNAATPGADDIIAPLLKAGLEPVAWLHRVILAVWRSSRALEAWKSVVVVPLYKARARTSAPTTTGEYPRQGLRAPVDAPLGAVCGRLAARGSMWFSRGQGHC